MLLLQGNSTDCDRLHWVACWMALLVLFDVHDGRKEKAYHTKDRAQQAGREVPDLEAQRVTYRSCHSQAEGRCNEEQTAHDGKNPPLHLRCDRGLKDGHKRAIDQWDRKLDSECAGQGQPEQIPRRQSQNDKAQAQHDHTHQRGVNPSPEASPYAQDDASRQDTHPGYRFHQA